MSRNLLALAILLITALNNFSAICTAQDAQAQATAGAARHQAASDSGRSNLDIATPTALAAPKRDDSDSGAQTEQLKRRAGEKGGPDAEGRTLMLGMKLQEADHGSVKVVDVGAATPAFEGGIRKGDQIVLFQNFKSNDYRKWIDGMRRLATSAKDGDMLTVVVMRDGNPVTSKIRVPESHVGPVQLPLGPPPGQQQQGAGSPPPAAVGSDEVGAANTNVAIENTGPFVNFFGDQNGAAAERAVAELYRTENSKVDQDTGNPRTPSAPSPHGVRIGLAGFRNDLNGMVVMVDVGGLEPGNYTVRIGDPAAAVNQPPTSADKPNGPRLPVPTQPQSSSQPMEISRNVLADVAQSAELTPGATAPATGAVKPTSAAAIGQPIVNGTQFQERNDQVAKPAGTAGVNEIGTLTIDQSGTGRMQHVVEGIRVRNVVGQAFVISMSTSSGAKTLPANLDSTVDPVQTKPENSAATPSAARGTSAAAAAGIIHLISDRTPASPTGGQPGALDNPSTPANNSIPAPAGPQH